MLKKDCFAFDESNFDCKALDKLYCTKEKCCFYKTKERNEKEEKKHKKYILKSQFGGWYMRELLDNYNRYLADIKTKEYEIKKLELEEITISGSNFSINGDIKPKRIYEF